jgi:hypothetical protein
VDDTAPFSFVASTSLHDSFSNWEVLSLDDTVGLGVVPGNADVMNPVLLANVIRGGDEG